MLLVMAREEADQARRYEKSLRNAARMIDVADEAFVYRNDHYTGHELIAVYENGKSIHKTHDLDWLP